MNCGTVVIFRLEPFLLYEQTEMQTISDLLQNQIDNGDFLIHTPDLEQRGLGFPE